MSFEEFFAAIEQGDLSLVNRILAEGPGALEARNAGGLSPIMVAAYWGQTQVLNRLVGAKKDNLDFWESATTGATARLLDLIDQQPDLVVSRSPDGFTALHLAVFFGHPETAQTLIKAGADVSARTNNALANQPLHAAVAGSDAGSRLASARVLLEAGADVNQRQSGGFTPLMSAAQNDDRELAELLLSAGADIATVDDEGLTAYGHATKAGHQNLGGILQNGLPIEKSD